MKVCVERKIGAGPESLAGEKRSPMIRNAAQARAVADALLLPGCCSYDRIVFEAPYRNVVDGDVVSISRSIASENRLVEEVRITGSLREGVWTKIKASLVSEE